jgi:hypothetical protein
MLLKFKIKLSLIIFLDLPSWKQLSRKQRRELVVALRPLGIRLTRTLIWMTTTNWKQRESWRKNTNANTYFSDGKEIHNGELQWMMNFSCNSTASVSSELRQACSLLWVICRCLHYACVTIKLCNLKNGGAIIVMQQSTWCWIHSRKD